METYMYYIYIPSIRRQRYSLKLDVLIVVHFRPVINQIIACSWSGDSINPLKNYKCKIWFMCWEIHPGATKDPGGATIDLTKNLAQWYWISVSHRVYIWEYPLNYFPYSLWICLAISSVYQHVNHCLATFLNKL